MIFLFERYGCVDSISGIYAVKRCPLQAGCAGECEKLGNLSSSYVFTDRSSFWVTNFCSFCSEQISTQILGFSRFSKNHLTSNSCNFVPTEPISMFLVLRMSSSSWNIQKWHLQPDILSSTHPSGSKREANFRKIPKLATRPMYTIPFLENPVWSHLWDKFRNPWARQNAHEGVPESEIRVKNVPEMSYLARDIILV